LVGNPEANIPLEDLGVNERIILEWILEKYGGKEWTGCIWLRIGTSGCNESSNSTKGEEFLH
jgi:hypothetical protein